MAETRAALRYCMPFGRKVNRDGGRAHERSWPNRQRVSSG